MEVVVWADKEDVVKVVNVSIVVVDVSFTVEMLLSTEALVLVVIEFIV